MVKLEHIGIAVKDINQSIALYESLLNTPCYKTEIVENFFSSIFSKYNLNYISPSQIRAHRWKYSNPIVSMFDKDNEIDFDSTNYLDYIELCKKYNLYLTGDWVFGQRAPKCVLGAIQLSSIFLGKDLLSVEGSLP